MTSSDAPVKGFQLKDISPRAWQHPADRAATAALASVPYLDKVVRTLIELGYERALRQVSLGASVRLGEQQLPEVWSDHVFAYSTLDIAEVPPLYVTQYPQPNAFAIGAKRPIVVVQSELLQLLDASQRRAVFAHEAAHILADHQLYRTALLILLQLSNAAVPLPLRPVRVALLEWYRATELSCDRAAALVTRDPLAVCRTMLSMAAGTMVEQLDLDAFLTQSMEYAETGNGLERLTRLMLDLNQTHPLPVRRTRELMTWVRSGEFDRIVGGEYVRREEPVSPRAEAGDAVSFYSDRFRDAFKDAGETLGQGGQRIADWLRKAREDIGGAGGSEEE
ncbi:M48 family metallopeptidase [Conexibacter arvalis]|uniref:Zn-dependent protease with chaperone function n=1 Tax=Conexibacter arvalis TaxID=912552 RepID=A0A840I8P1_9ACTN|nr:M48 family metallopeptidase [Conexibacter arvalis]MBB4660892.1 Zn-dependent protease with chaperone function [Conexibacter arvalis]